MKELALNVGGTQITLPASIQGLQNKADNYGQGIIRPVISLLFVIAIIIALFYIVYGGIKWITSGGDPKQIDAARNTILYASIGLAVAFLSFGVVNFIAYFLHTPLLGQ